MQLEHIPLTGRPEIESDSSTARGAAMLALIPLYCGERLGLVAVVEARKASHFARSVAFLHPSRRQAAIAHAQLCNGVVLRVCLGLQLWVTHLMNMWLRHVVVTWSRHVVAKSSWSKTSSRIEKKKKSITATMWDSQKFKRKMKLPLVSKVWIMCASDNCRRSVTYFHHPRFCTRCKTQFGDHFTTTSHVVTSL